MAFGLGGIKTARSGGRTITRTASKMAFATWWNENGKKSSEEHYKNGKRDGLRTEWNENGQEAF